ncbi:hypothetical protein [Spirulina major]|uniref:hypothetical protein n=1 Tax=Spirulina major TaxID=270636 RepID=UPI000934DC85|nr:hypothetical protein [Spirulina major]
MDDSDLLTLKAFTAAYIANDRPPIPELLGIQADLENRANELDAIACNHSQLCNAYQQARTLLISAASTRKAGLNVTPIPPVNDDSKDVENLVRVLDEQSKAELKSALQAPEN